MTRNTRPNCFRFDRGFTILEILVVVAVIAISASVILLNLSVARPDQQLGEHAKRLGKTMQLLMQEAILDDRNYALSVAPQSYLVLEYDGAEWQQTADPFFQSLQKKHIYNDELIIDKNLVSIEDNEKPEPHILLLSSGEMTVFQWDIEDPDNNLRVRLQSSLLGKIQIEGPAEELL